MSLFGLAKGQPQTTSLLLVAGAQNVVTVSTTTRDSYDVTDILISNMDSSGRTVTVSRYDGATEYPLLFTYPLTAAGTAGSSYLLTMPIRLPQGWSIRATPSVASQVLVHVSYVVP